MKNYFLCIGIAITITGCSYDDSKDEDVIQDNDINEEEVISIDIDSVKQELIGTWNWVYSSGGIAGITNTPESLGYTARLEINDEVVRGFRNDSLIYVRNYSIEIHDATNFTESHLVMVYEGGGFPHSFTVNDDELILVGECSDCFISLYTKE